MKLTANAKIQIRKPTTDVFEAIVNPDHMRGYFIANSSGRLSAGSTVMWSFPEFPDQFPVMAKEIQTDSYISFDWSGGLPNQLVEIFLSATEDHATIVRIVEHEMENTPEGINQMKGQTEGWANFLACLKAYLEYGINLRKGAFDFMRTAE
ncbi:SRPBCC domain-containing protein [Sphingobacterium suaedae]|uniref:SRPBCC domain-containing protein n=1 Tax=Sphingobacterium suaedae TaxID=1686402 RepID=A0ABW5KJ16_9SPHI